MKRREYLVSSLTGAIMMTSGCTESINDLTGSPTASKEADNPWGSSRLIVGLEQQVAARRDIHEIIEVALEYWQENALTFAGYSVSFEYLPNAADPDIQVILVNDIRTCGIHDGEYSGCMESSGAGDSRSAKIRLEDGYRKEWMVNTLKHELGHALGLDHGDEPAHIMSDRLEDVIPDYNTRRKAIESYNDAFEPFNQGHDAWSDAIDSWNNEFYNDAQNSFKVARDNWLKARKFIQISVRKVREINESRAEELLSSPDENLRLSLGAARTAIKMTRAAISEDWDRVDRLVDETNELMDRANRHEFDNYDRFVMALGFPDPDS